MWFTDSLVKPNDPIFRAELAHQGRTLPRRRRWVRQMLRFILYLSFVLAYLFLGVEIAAVLFNYDPEPLLRSLNVARVLPVTVAVILHFSLMLQALAKSADSIARERQGNNWDMLVMTGIDARSIILGKWWAIVRSMWPGYVTLVLLRIPVIIWLTAETSRRSYAYNYLFQTPPQRFPPEAYMFILAALYIFMMTAVNLLFTAACGVSAISARSRSSAWLLGRAIATRLLVLLAPVLVGLWAFGAFGLWRLDWVSYPLSWALGTMLENGVNMAGMLVSWRYGGTPDMNHFWLSSVMINLTIYFLLTWLLLRIAQWQAVRQNALPPLPSESSKPL